ncbi:MAG: InlB B-repeat-containing protein, partial [Clostridia bacterium]|nr:InlB B-repeat-containing protein [Clostridia bacterium]
YIWTDKDNSGNAVANKEFLTDYWRESVKEYGEYENIYTLGMRGVHDTGFVTNMPSYTQAIAEVIAAQVDILEEVLQKDIDEIPTAFVAYKDVLEYYNRTGVKDSDGNEIVHLNIPESTVIMYCDDNFGYMRQTADEYERGTTGRAGVYYHLSYYGGPRSYLWLTSTQPGLIREELTKAHSTGSDKIWVVNVGDIKPAEKEIEYYARLARDVEGTNETDIAEIYAAEAKRDFNLSDSDAQVYAGIMDEYYALANSKRPEFYRASDTADGFNIAPFVYGDEAQRYLDRYNAIVAKAEILYEKLDDIKKDAFFETVLYPLRSSRNMAKNSLQTERANMSAEQGMGIASQRYAKEAEDAATQITADTKYYNETVADGKWNGIMALQPKWGADAVIYYDGCDAKVATRSDAKTLTELDYTDMAIAIGGKIADNPSINLSAYDSYAKYFDIVNTGYGSFDYAVTSDNEAIRLSKAEGTVYGSDRIYLTLDKSKATDNSQAAVTVTQLLDNHVINEKTITVSISYPNVTDMAGRAYYVESDGVVSVEAEHYSAANNNDSYQWIVEKDFGRSGDTVKAYPDTANDAADNTYQTSSAHLEYDIYFTEAGTYTLDLYRMPTLNEGTTKMRCAVGLDDSAPIRLGGTAAVDGNSKTNMWGKQVLVNSEKLTTTVTVSSVGKHTLKLYTVSTGFVADKIVLHRDNVYSYFGAPESYNSEYNNQIDMPNDAADIETDESGITKTFEPKAVIGAVTKATDKLTVPLYAISESLSEAVVVAASYDENGVMTSVDFKKVSFNEGEAQTELTLPADAENYAVTVIDGFTNMHLIAPYKSNGTIVTDAGSSYMKVVTDLTEYESKKSAIIISDKAITENIQSADIAYFYGGAITNTLYKSIPFTDKGEYNVRVGIDGEEPIDEAVSTVVNIEPDNNGAKITEYEQSFDGYTLNISDWVLGTSCAKTNPNLTIETKSGDDKYLKLTQNNTQVAQTIGAYKIFDANDRVDIAANPNQTISADVMFGKMNGSGSWGTSQISIGSSSLAKSSAYFSSGEPDYGAASDSGHILLMQYEGGTGKLTINGQLIAEGSNNFADKWINVSADADFTNKTIDATVTIEGGEPVIFKDLQFYAENNINDIGSIYLRAAKPNGAVCIDNLEVYTTTAPQYAISINAVDSLENQIEGAVITVKDESGKTILSEASGDFAGKYMLTKGTYTISASAFGYSPVTDRELVLNERLDSKTVTIELEKLPVQQYTVTFDANGGKINGKDTDTVVVNGGETVTSITPTREHYSFVEWQLDGDAYNFETPVTGDITLTAVWEIDKVTVSFDAGTGADAFISTDASRQVDYNTAIGNPPTPNNIKANYAFAHWLSDQTTYSIDEVAALAVTQPLSFLAKYTITVKLDGNGGLFGSDETTTVSRLEGTTLGTVSEPEKTHYIFTGWKKGGVDVNDITTEVITAPVTYTAQWTHIERTVTFDLNGGEVDNSAENVDVKVNDGEKVTPPSVSRDGYTLKGWKKDNADFDLNTEITADITLVAEWEEIPANSYSVTFDLNGASVSVPAQTVQENNTVTEPSAPERTGYTFNGWQLNGSVYNFSTPVTGNITLTAQWTINQYDVKFMDGDTQLGETQSIDYNETAIVPPNPEKIGYTFGGWSTTENGTTAAQDIASNPVTSAVTYYAIWTPTEYTISYFDADGTTAINQEPANYTIETDDITLTAPTKEGYTFEGWYDN